MRWILTAFLLSSCTIVNVGWARVDFLTAPTDVMVCSFTVDKEGDTVGKCADWNDVNEGLGAIGYEQKLKQLYNK